MGEKRLRDEMRRLYEEQSRTTVCAHIHVSGIPSRELDSLRGREVCSRTSIRGFPVVVLVQRRICGRYRTGVLQKMDRMAAGDELSNTSHLRCKSKVKWNITWRARAVSSPLEIIHTLC